MAKKSILAVILSCLLITELTGCNGNTATKITTKYENQSTNATSEPTMLVPQQYFDSPLETAKFFTEAMSEKDFDKAMSAFAIYEKAENYNWIMKTMRSMSWYPLATPPAELGTISIGERIGEVSQQLKFIVFSLTELRDMLTDVKMRLLEDGYLEQNVSITDVEESIINVNLSDLELVYFGTPVPALRYNNVRNFAMYAKIYGALEYRDYVAIYKYNNQYYIGGYMMARYEKGWQIESINSIIEGTDQNGKLDTLEEQEYSSIDDFLDKYKKDFNKEITDAKKSGNSDPRDLNDLYSIALGELTNHVKELEKEYKEEYGVTNLEEYLAKYGEEDYEGWKKFEELDAEQQYVKNNQENPTDFEPYIASNIK